jgi:hypothetical protein
VVKLRETPEAPGMRLQQLRPELLVLTLRPGTEWRCVMVIPKIVEMAIYIGFGFLYNRGRIRIVLHITSFRGDT